MKSKTYCPDCGPETVSHAIERWSVRIDGVLSRVNRPFEWMAKVFAPVISAARPGRAAAPMAKFFAAIKLGTLVSTPDEKNNWRARVLWEETSPRGIIMKEFRPFGLPRELFFASYGGDARAFDGLPRPRGAPTGGLNWMDDKGIIIKKFRAAGIPVPRGKTCRTTKEAETVFKEINGPAIVKPTLGSRSRHTYVGIVDTTELRRAFLKAKEISPYVVVEQELSGFVFRITLVDGKIAGIMRREPPHVIGDGKHTVRELVAEENKNPLRHGVHFHELPTNEESAMTLAEQNLSLDSIPEHGVMVILNKKVSRAYGASTTEITKIHPDNRALFLHIGKVLNDPLVGVDFMIGDMEKSWREQYPCGVIECNSLPFIDLHHYPLKGPAQNVAGLVWDMIFPQK